MLPFQVIVKLGYSYFTGMSERCSLLSQIALLPTYAQVG
jgi:hypothetical protein